MGLVLYAHPPDWTAHCHWRLTDIFATNNSPVAHEVDSVVDPKARVPPNRPATTSESPGPTSPTSAPTSPPAVPDGTQDGGCEPWSKFCAHIHDPVFDSRAMYEVGSLPPDSVVEPNSACPTWVPRINIEPSDNGSRLLAVSD